jgi:hypothetical protein
MTRCHITLCVLLLTGCAARAPAPAARSSIADVASVEDVVRVRCARDGSDVFTTWTGSVYSFVPGERQKQLFTVVGMNVARCLRDREGWFLTSRELMYYADPESGAPLERWANPWTGETVPVMHVANALVQMRLGGGAPIQVVGNVATLSIDVPLFYPNRLAAAAELRAYSPEAHYQAGEFFTLAADASAIANRAAATVPELSIGWFRISPWLPWMNMGERAGRLVFVARGKKVRAPSELPEVLRRDIEARLPLYKAAPRCFVDAKNETSWTYFAAHLQPYLAGARFPMPAPARPGECEAAGPAAPPPV